MSAEPPQVRFKNNAIEFANLIRDLIVNAHENYIPITTTVAVLDIAIFALSSADENSLMETFINKSSPHWKEIKSRDVNFFLKDGLVIFEGLPSENVADFNRLFTASIYTPIDPNVKMSTDLYTEIQSKGVVTGDIVTLSRDGKEYAKFKKTPFIDADLMEQVWLFFHGSSKQSISYIHFKRKPDPVTKKYTQNYISNISVKAATELWGITEFR